MSTLPVSTVLSSFNVPHIAVASQLWFHCGDLTKELHNNRPIFFAERRRDVEWYESDDRGQVYSAHLAGRVLDLRTPEAMDSFYEEAKATGVDFEPRGIYEGFFSKDVAALNNDGSNPNDMFYLKPILRHFQAKYDYVLAYDALGHDEIVVAIVLNPKAITNISLA